MDIGIASANDNVDGIVAVTNDAPATFPIGVTTVTYSSTDLAGNTATATQSIYVSYIPTVGGGNPGGGGGTNPPPAGGGATVGMEAVYWHHNDHLGTPQAMTDINGTKVWEMSQTPFGIATVNEDVDGDGLLVINNFRFPGQYYDQETGLFYNYFRTYDPEGGVYPQHDPIGLNGGMNPFAYVSGNPITNIDPLGLKIIWGGYVLSNSHVKSNLTKLNSIIEKNTGKCDFILRVTGGDRYIDAQGKHRSSTNHQIVKNSDPKSPHLVKHGARSVDLSVKGVSDGEFDKALKGTDFSTVLRDYTDKHTHINLPNRKRFGGKY